MGQFHSNKMCIYSLLQTVISKGHFSTRQDHWGYQGCAVWRLLANTGSRQTLLDTVTGGRLLVSEPSAQSRRAEGTSPDPPEKKIVKVFITQLCPTLCNPMECSPRGSSVHGILQARVLEWGAIPFSRESSQPGDRTRVSCIVDNFFFFFFFFFTVRATYTQRVAGRSRAPVYPTWQERRSPPQSMYK